MALGTRGKTQSEKLKAQRKTRRIKLGRDTSGPAAFVKTAEATTQNFEQDVEIVDIVRAIDDGEGAHAESLGHVAVIVAL